ncbi:hypothetical protein GW17_00008425 [Ensete ventricosum]|nr:hypothetical protein GW17_00008425 [Ensete ventricosum]RZR94282.1 hypothetical protein BHM03_00022946 [Ensete ventricosum]
MGDVGEQVAAAVAAKEADKEKKRRRRQSRRQKQNLLVLPGCLFSVDTSCGRPGNWTGIMGAGPISASDIAFNSLPPMHFNGDGNFGGSNSTFLPAGMIGEEISKSCPLPASSVPAKEVPAPVAAPLRNSKKYFAPHWSEQAVEEAIEAYCTIDGLLVDVLINGVSSQNRAYRIRGKLFYCY